MNLLDLRTKLLGDLPSDAVKYDLGCGTNPEEGFVGLDLLSPREDVRKVDLFTYPWAIADETVDFYRASHFVEHVPDWDAHFAEIYRTLKPGGHYEIIVPYYWNSRWAQDPDHKQCMVGERFRYLMHEWRKLNRVAHYGARVNFSLVGWFELLDDDFMHQGYDDQYIEFAKRHFINVISDVACILRKEPMPEAA